MIEILLDFLYVLQHFRIVVEGKQLVDLLLLCQLSWQLEILHISLYVTVLLVPSLRGFRSFPGILRGCTHPGGRWKKAVGDWLTPAAAALLNTEGKLLFTFPTGHLQESRCSRTCLRVITGAVTIALDWKNSTVKIFFFTSEFLLLPGLVGGPLTEIHYVKGGRVCMYNMKW